MRNLNYIFSSTDNKLIKYKGYSTNGIYSVISLLENNNFILFLGNGTKITAMNLTINADSLGNVVLEKKNNKFYLNNQSPVTVTYNNKSYKFPKGDLREISIY